MDKFNDLSDIKNDKNSKSSNMHFELGILTASIIFIVINFINKQPSSTNIQIVGIIFAGETAKAFYKFSINKKVSDLILGIVGIIIIISAIILNI